MPDAGARRAEHDSDAGAAQPDAVAESDLRNYYMIGYSPTTEKFDGKFRAIG